MAPAMASGSVGSKVASVSTSSRSEELPDATTGAPQAMASATGRPYPS